MKKIFSTHINRSSVYHVGFKIQNGSSGLVAILGSESQVCLIDRTGNKKIAVTVRGPIIDFDWNRNGQLLGIIDSQNHHIYIWEAKTSSLKEISTSFKDNFCVIAWSKLNERLAIGTSKGNLLVYDFITTRKYPVLGLHTRRISSVIWSTTDLLATVGDDKVVSLNTSNGDLIKQLKFEDPPTDIKFAHLSSSKYGLHEDNAISCIVNEKQLLIWKFQENAQASSYSFNETYGNIVGHIWRSTDNIILGFSDGSLVVISMTEFDSGKELLRIQEYVGDCYFKLAISEQLLWFATATSKCIKVHELDNLKEVVDVVEIDDVDRVNDLQSPDMTLSCNDLLCSAAWSDDGKLMGIMSSRNILHIFLSQLPLMTCVSSNGIVARFTSLLEITLEPLCTNSPSDKISRVVPICVEPTFMGIGPSHLAVGTEYSASFYNISNAEDTRVVSEQTYPEAVSTIKLNEEYAAVGTVNNHIIFHWIEPNTFSTKLQSMIPDKDYNSKTCNHRRLKAQDHSNKLDLTTGQRKTFPEKDERIIDFDLTNCLLCYSTDSNMLYQFHIDEWAIVNKYEHYCPIISITSSKMGLMLSLIDAQRNAYVFNAVSSTLVEIPNFSPNISRILWNFTDFVNPLLMAISKDFFLVYRYFTARVFISEDLGGRGISNDEIMGNANLSVSTNNRIPSTRRPTYGECRLIERVNLPLNHTPIGFHDEYVCLLSPKGRLVHITLPSYAFKAYTKILMEHSRTTTATSSENVSNRSYGAFAYSPFSLERIMDEKFKLTDNDQVAYFEKALNVGAFEEALVLADRIQLSTRWHQLARVCIICLEFDVAIQAFRRLQDCGSVIAIQKMMNIEEKQALYGNVCVFLGEFNRGQEYFLASSRPEAALEMRRDLLHWDAALQLGRTLHPNEVPFISREYAFELECVGDYVNALIHYERALERPKISAELTHYSDFDEGAANLLVNEFENGRDCQSDEWNDHADICNAGIIRNTIRLGDHRGVLMALKNSTRALKKECAWILEQAQQWSDAAVLYEAAGQMDAAIIVYLKSKNYEKAGELLRKTKVTCQLYQEYAKAREACGEYAEAISAYESAKDWGSMVRLLLDKMNNSTEAVRIVKESESVEAAKTVAQYFTKIGDFASAIRFLLLSKCYNAAYELALKHRKMEIYANWIGMDASSDEYKNIAVHFECERNSFLAGKFFLYAKQYGKAVRHLLRVPYQSENSSIALDLAINAVGAACDKKLTHMVLTYLMGEIDGVAKDPRHLFRLHMSLQQHREAARTAVIIGREEQANGNYRNAHDLLFSMVQELRQRHLKVPTEMLDNLGLLHSYILAKLHIKSGNHMMAARLLIRISQNVSKFPLHIVPILTSTVIECHKVGLKHTGYTYASMVLRAEYREKIDPRYRRRFEGLVRRPEKLLPKEAEILGSAAPCPFCAAAVPEYELTCGSCRNHLLYCVLTGKHVVKEDMTLCPNCAFPLTYTTLISLFENQPDLVCPMCSSAFVREKTQRLMDAVEVLQNWNSGSPELDPDDSQTLTSGMELSDQQDKILDEATSNEANTNLTH